MTYRVLYILVSALQNSINFAPQRLQQHPASKPDKWNYVSCVAYYMPTYRATIMFIQYPTALVHGYMFTVKTRIQCSAKVQRFIFSWALPIGKETLTQFLASIIGDQDSGEYFFPLFGLQKNMLDFRRDRLDLGRSKDHYTFVTAILQFGFQTINRREIFRLQ